MQQSHMLLKDLLPCQVYLARWKCALVACKVLRKEQVAAAELESFRREAEMLQAMNHPYVLRLFGAVFDSHRVRQSFVKPCTGRLRTAPAHSLYKALILWLTACVGHADDGHQRGASPPALNHAQNLVNTLPASMPAACLLCFPAPAHGALGTSPWLAPVLREPCRVHGRLPASP